MMTYYVFGGTLSLTQSIEDFLTSKWPGSILYCADAATGHVLD